MQRLEREPDFEQFLKVLLRTGKPTYLPFYEHIADAGFIARRTETRFDKMTPSEPGYWEIYVDFWLGMGFDCVPLEILPNFPTPQANEHTDSIGSDSRAAFKCRAEFEQFPWPDDSSPIDFAPFEIVSGLLPKGVKIIGGMAGGPYEWTSWLIGVTRMCYALQDDAQFVWDVMKKIGSLQFSTVRQLGTMDSMGALRFGDDLGFKTSTFLSPDMLREHLFPIYREIVEESHKHSKPFMLHSCGNLDEIYDDLIDYCKIDAKHSFENVILPVDEFKKQYGDRVTPIGGLDVDYICRNDEEDIRAYARKMIEACFADGYWALGTGNSLPDYMPVQNYMFVLEEGIKVIG